jgi:hypothetical protein
MATDNRWARGRAARAAGRSRPSRGAVLRSLLLVFSVFVLAVLGGVLLSGAAPAVPAEPPGAIPDERAARAPVSGPAPELVFAQSMIYTGTAGLGVSVAGLVMVGRRRRLW